MGRVWLAILVSVTVSNAFARGETDICESVSVHHVSTSFEDKNSISQSWIDDVSIEEGEAGHKIYRVKISGKVRGNWIHQLWAVRAESKGVGCKVNAADVLEEKCDN